MNTESDTSKSACGCGCGCSCAKKSAVKIWLGRALIVLALGALAVGVVRERMGKAPAKAPCCSTCSRGK